MDAQIALLNEQIKSNEHNAKNSLDKKDEEIKKQKAEYELLTKKMEELKSDTALLIGKNREEMAVAEAKQKKDNEEYGEKIKNLGLEIASHKKHIDALMLESEKDFNKFKTYLEDAKKLNTELLATNKSLEDSIKNGEKSIVELEQKHEKELIAKEENIKNVLQSEFSINDNVKFPFGGNYIKKNTKIVWIHSPQPDFFNLDSVVFEQKRRKYNKHVS